MRVSWPNNVRRHKDYLLAFGAYLVMTMIATFPLAFNFTTDIAGQGGDGLFSLWTMWWFRKSIAELHMSPWFTMYVFHPTGVTLLSTDLAPLNVLLGAYLQPILGSASTYNALFWGSFVLSGLGTYCLAKYLTGNKFASLFAGAVFMLYPYRFAHGLGHLMLLQTQWIPFYVLFMIKTAREPSRKNPLWAATFLLLTLIASSYYYFVFEALIFLLVLAFRLAEPNRESLAVALRRFLLWIFASVLLAGPWVCFLAINVGGDVAASRPLSELIFYSADILAFFTPSFLHPFWKPIVGPLYSIFTGNFIEATVFVGYSVFGLATYCILAERKNHDVKLFGAMGLSFGLLALGPVLHFLGRYRFTNLQIAIPMPDLLVYYIVPAFRFMRVPSRFGIVIGLSLAILTAFSVKRVLKSTTLTAIRGVNLRLLLAVLLLLVLLVEFLAVPYPTFRLNEPLFYQRLAQEKEDFAVLELPMVSQAVVELYLWYQTIHGKRIVGGVISREAPEYAAAFIRNTPVVSDLLSPSVVSIVLPNSSDILIQDKSKIADSIFNYYNIRYVIFHKDFLESRELLDKSQIVEKWLKGVKVFEDTGIIAYEIPTTETPMMFTVIGDRGWYGAELWSGNTSAPWRWMENNGTLIIVNPSSIELRLNLEFTAVSFARSRTLTIYFDNTLVESFPVGFTSGNRFATRVISIPPGETTVKFYTPEGSESPASLGVSADNRRLSISFQDIEIIEA